MASLKEYLSGIFSDAFEAQQIDRKYGIVVESQRPDLGQFQCNGALAAAKEAKKNPRMIAQALVKQVEKNEAVESLSIAGPGFINITLADSFLSSHLEEIRSDSRLGCEPRLGERTVVIDFGGPNVAKPMHVGHLRSSIIGDSLQRLFRFLGATVHGDNHMGDWGTQMGMLICELRRRNPELPYFDENTHDEYPSEAPVSLSDLEEMYPTASSRCKGDEEAMSEALKATVELQQGRPGYVALWKHFVLLSVDGLKKDFQRLGVTFDHWLGESFYKDRMDALVAGLKETGNAEESEGAWVMRVARDDDTREIPPLMLVKSGGGYLYGTSDLATIQYRVEEFGADEIVYVVDKRQDLHFEQVFRAARKAGIAVDVSMNHAGFGTVNGPDGKPFKTRAGGVMKLGDLMEQVVAKARERMDEAGVANEFSEEEREDVALKVGLAALKFADLSNHRASDYVFDIDKFTKFEGKTGPYLLYSAVRIKSILRNAAERNVSAGPIQPPTDAERNLMVALSHLPDVLNEASGGYLPHYLCDFAYALSQEFNRFYRDCHILNEKDTARQGSWMSLASLVLAELELVLGLLGIEVPERM